MEHALVVVMIVAVMCAMPVIVRVIVRMGRMVIV